MGCGSTKKKSPDRANSQDGNDPAYCPEYGSEIVYQAGSRLGESLTLLKAQPEGKAGTSVLGTVPLPFSRIFGLNIRNLELIVEEAPGLRTGTIHSLAKCILQKEKTDPEKVWIIFRWILLNLQCDEHFPDVDPNPDPDPDPDSNSDADVDPVPADVNVLAPASALPSDFQIRQQRELECEHQHQHQQKHKYESKTNPKARAKQRANFKANVGRESNLKPVPENEAEPESRSMLNLAARVWERGRGNCHELATLFKIIANEVKLLAEVVIGLLKDVETCPFVSDMQQHAWNVVRINNRWQLLDLALALQTKAALNTLSPSLAECFVGVHPVRFARVHIPAPQIEGYAKWQLLPQPLSQDEFERRLTVPLNAYSVGFVEASPDAGRLSCTESVTFQLHFDPSHALPALDSSLARVRPPRLSRGPDKQLVPHATFLQRLNHTYTLYATLPCDDEYELAVWTQEGNEAVITDPMSGQLVIEKAKQSLPLFKARLLNSGQQNEEVTHPEQFLNYHTLNAVLHEPTSGLLSLDVNYKFSLSLKNDIMVGVHVGANVVLLKPTQDGIECEGNSNYEGWATIEEDPVVVAAKPEPTGPWIPLLRYNMSTTKHLEPIVHKNHEVLQLYGIQNYPKYRRVDAAHNVCEVNFDVQTLVGSHNQSQEQGQGQEKLKEKGQETAQEKKEGPQEQDVQEQTQGSCELQIEIEDEHRQQVPHSWFLQREGVHHKLLLAFKQKGQYLLRISVVSSDESPPCWALEYQIVVKRSRNVSLFPTQYALYQELKAKLLEPMEGVLPLGTEQKFALYVEAAQEVSVVVKDNVYPLTKQPNNLFEGLVNVEDADVYVCASDKLKDVEGQHVILHYGVELQDKKDLPAVVEKTVSVLELHHIVGYPLQRELTAKAQRLHLEFHANEDSGIVAEVKSSKEQKVPASIVLRRAETQCLVDIVFPYLGEYYLRILAQNYKSPLSVALKYQVHVPLNQ